MYVDVAVLMTTYTEEYNRVSMHGVNLELVKKQAASLGLDLLNIPLPADCSNEIYEDRMAVALQRLRSMGVLEVVFGDIFLEDVRRHRENNLLRVSGRIIPIKLTNLLTRTLTRKTRRSIGMKTIINDKTNHRTTITNIARVISKMPLATIKGRDIFTHEIRVTILFKTLRIITI